MSPHQAFRRQPVPQQVAQHLQAMTIPAPTRGIIESENYAYMQPGAALICDNWMPTMRGLKLRTGCIRWAVLPETTPIISGFEYSSGSIHKMYAANVTKLYDVTTETPALVKGGQLSGNYCAAQLANAAGDFLIVANDAGDPLLRFNGTTWATLNHTTPANWANSTVYAIGARATDTSGPSYWKCAVGHTSPAGPTTFSADRTANPTRWVPDSASDGNSWITGPAGSDVEHGSNLTYVCKYRNRLFFIEASSMNAWYLGIDSVGGALNMIPLSGAAKKGGHLLFAAVWSLDAGDGIDDKLVFCTSLGELLIFTGSNPADAANWRQEGRYEVSTPMGMNAHLNVGGDLLIATTEGIVPTSAAITKGKAELELAAITRNIKAMWRREAIDKREWPWTMKKWDEYGGIFITWPGGEPGNRYCAVVNAATGAFARYVGYDATCFMQMGENFFFGTQGGIVMQADRTGYDDGVAYVARFVGGWGMFKCEPGQAVWYQARAAFQAGPAEPFQPQIACTTDYIVTLPMPPPPGLDPGPADVWDEGLWDTMLWDAPSLAQPVMRNTGWVSIGATGFTHAPIVQVTVAQVGRPDVELISIGTTFERLGVNV